ncbi:unnamed protein product [Microthlaspi erraticum]|uniref:glucan endo-1,3-beta-D-glucosidase n=1 Tax=Microthlaspi erraticum TaxID=1685480 RepID=A0A6D2L216_9BRAS|nr:unnamed protein product [Microthlaspi erraticum]
MDSLAFYLLLLVSLTAVAIPPTTSATTIGVTYSTPDSISGSVILSPDRIAEKIVSMKIPAVRLLDFNPEMIRAFADTNVSLFLSVPNPLVPLLASDRSIAKAWVYRHVLPFYPRTNISIISVGNDAISDSPDVSPSLLRAMQNVRRSLKDLGIYKISVSTTFSFFNIVPAAFIPSAAQFQKPTGDVIIRPILQFLERTNSSFLINLYPYNVYRSSFPISMGFALFVESPFGYKSDLNTGVRYRNLFDMMVDAVFSSMAAMGHEKLPLIVAETGWLTSGARAEGISEVYVFELVEEEGKQGIGNRGLLHHNMTTSKYSFEPSDDDSKIEAVPEDSNSFWLGCFLFFVEVVVLYLMG